MVDLDELERLEREATPGPWEVDVDCTFDMWGRSGSVFVGQTESGDDASLLVAARNALPDLLAELRTLRADVAKLSRELERSAAETYRLQRDAAAWAKVREAARAVDVAELAVAFGATLDQLCVLEVVADALRAEEGSDR